MTTPLSRVRAPMQRDVERVLADCAQADPDRVLVVCVKDGRVFTFATDALTQKLAPAFGELVRLEVIRD